MKEKLQKFQEKIRQFEEQEAEKMKLVQDEDVPNRSTIPAFHIPKLRGAKKQSKSEGSSSSSMSESEIEENARALTDPKQIQSIYMEQDWKKLNLQNCKVKLLITALSMRNSQPGYTVKDRLVRWTGIANLGTVHSAVQIGPIILEWNDSGIIIPSPSYEWNNHRILCALDLVTFPVKDFFSKYVGPICNVVGNWNATKDYDEIKNNCQAFSEEILGALGLSNKYDGKIKKFLNSLGSTNPKDLSFSIKLNGDSKEVVFATHEHLDQFCDEKKQILILNPGSEDWRLLKAFDRVFWLRYFALETANMDAELHQKLKRKYQCAAGSCFFGNPAVTETVLGPHQQMNDEEDPLSLE